MAYLGVVLVCIRGTADSDLQPIQHVEWDQKRLERQEIESVIAISCAGLPRRGFGRHGGGAETGQGG